jgi:hypothetical protein
VLSADTRLRVLKINPWSLFTFALGGAGSRFEACAIFRSLNYMKRRDFTKAIAGIAAGVVAGTKVFADDKKPADKTKAQGCGGKDGCGGAKGKSAAAGDKAPKHACKAKNECKGQGGCKTGDAGCAGKNTCKGKGGCSVPVKH